MSVALKNPEAPFLFDDGGKAHVRISGPDFEQVSTWLLVLPVGATTDAAEARLTTVFPHVLCLQRVPLVMILDPEAENYGTASFTMPPRIVWPPPPPEVDEADADAEGDGEGGGEGEEDKGDGPDDAEGDAAEAAAAGAGGKTEEADTGEGEGEGEAEVEGPGPRPKLKKLGVDVEITLNGEYYHKKFKYKYFGADRHPPHCWRCARGRGQSRHV